MISALPNSATDTPLSCKEWLVYNFQQTAGHVFTNASGICVPFFVLRDVAKFWRLTQAKVGGRFEYMMLSHRSINGISCFPEPIVTIHESLGQGGRNRSYENLLRDELRYTIWLILNATTIDELIYILKSPCGLLAFRNNLTTLFKVEIKKILNQCRLKVNGRGKD